MKLVTFLSAFAVALAPTVASACPGACSTSCSTSFGGYASALGVGILLGAGSIAAERMIRARRKP